MNNPFGIPDDLFIAVVKAVTEQQITKNPMQEKKPFVNPAELAKKSAETAKQLYDAYIAVGFNEKQAFELVKGILTAKKN
jgi:hypothetical protein